MKTTLLRSTSLLLLILGIAAAIAGSSPTTRCSLFVDRVTLTPEMMEEEQGSDGGDYGFVIRLPKIVKVKDLEEYTGSVYENGKELPLVADSRAEVDFNGQGRYIFKKRVLSLSSSDRTDPRTNEKTYVAAVDRDLTSQLWAISGGLLLIGLAGVIITRSKKPL